MSIAVLTQVYDEVRRLAIAGSVVAPGDFRLKKLIAPLEQAGARAPVFAKAAQAVKSLVECNEQSSAQALLELCTLVNAVLYTQGETGHAGDLKPIATTDLGLQTTQASARMLKPLLEALSTTGSGRLEIIKEAVERGAFRDLRLVQPALQGLDDVYPEIGELIADKVLPLYGKAILPELRSKIDIKGRAGHVRRLTLMHKLDPAGTRELVKQALEGGSKEVKVAAIACLGSEPEDLEFLLEHAAAKAKDVRGAALQSLAKLDATEAFDVLQKALTNADIDLAVAAVNERCSPQLLKFILEEARREVDNLFTLKDPKAVAKSSDRLDSLLNCLRGRDDKTTEAFLLKCFDRRDELLKVKGEGIGAGINQRIAGLMSSGSKKTRQTLVKSHADLDPDTLETACGAACRSLQPAEVFDIFSPYLMAKVDEKKKKDPAYLKRLAIAGTIGHDWRWRYYASHDEDDLPPIPWDPRWLDVAVAIRDLELIEALARPGHAGANTLLSEEFAAAFKKSKAIHEIHGLLATQVRVRHPDATDNLLAALEKHASVKTKNTWVGYNICRLIPDLPQSAVPKLEELLPKLHEKVIDQLADYVADLKAKV